MLWYMMEKKQGQLGRVGIEIMKNMAGIPGYSFIKMRLITKGLSGDKKFYLETEDGQRFLARISEGLEYERKKTEYELLMKVSKIGIPAPTPAGFGYCEDKSKIYNPDMFWRLLAFYLAGSAVTSIVWAKYFAPECMEEIMKLNTDIVRWYDGMKNTIPAWYIKSLWHGTEEQE